MWSAGRPPMLSGRFDIPDNRKRKRFGRRLADVGKHAQSSTGATLEQGLSG